MAVQVASCVRVEWNEKKIQNFFHLFSTFRDVAKSLTLLEIGILGGFEAVFARLSARETLYTFIWHCASSARYDQSMPNDKHAKNQEKKTFIFYFPGGRKIRFFSIFADIQVCATRRTTACMQFSCVAVSMCKWL